MIKYSKIYMEDNHNSLKVIYRIASSKSSDQKVEKIGKREGL